MGIFNRITLHRLALDPVFRASFTTPIPSEVQKKIEKIRDYYQNRIKASKNIKRAGHYTGATKTVSARLNDNLHEKIKGMCERRKINLNTGLASICSSLITNRQFRMDVIESMEGIASMPWVYFSCDPIDRISILEDCFENVVGTNIPLTWIECLHLLAFCTDYTLGFIIVVAIRETNDFLPFEEVNYEKIMKFHGEMTADFPE